MADDNENMLNDIGIWRKGMIVLRSKYPLISRFTVFLLLPLFALALYFYLQLLASLPADSGNRQLQGLKAIVEISRDSYGVPHIKSSEDRDVYFAMGYLHAQDRLWQLEIQKRTAAGKLSELYGQQSLDLDIWMRTLKLYEKSATDWPALSPEAQASLSAYKDGINTWLSEGNSLPAEFGLWNITPTMWTELDSLAWTKVFALNLSGNMWQEIGNYVALQQLDQDKVADLLGERLQVEMDWVAKIRNTEDYSEILGMAPRLEQWLKIGGTNVGSNAWVVSGTLTDSGAAVIANDPHLGLQIPSLWYVVKQQGKLIQSTGMSLVGLPLVIFGHNQRIAWAGTSMMADTQDIQIEEINELKPDQYLYQGKWHEIEKTIGTIKVRQPFPASLNRLYTEREVLLRSTQNGPIISDLAGSFDQPMSLSWVALKAIDTTYESFYRVNYAHDWQSFLSALSKHVSPALNILYADVDNNIGYHGVGNIPLRRQQKGSLPLSTINKKDLWQGYVPFEHMPSEYNPLRGFIASANNDVTTKDYPYFISSDWAEPSRYQRITQLLVSLTENKARLSFDAHKQIQVDTLDVGLAKLVSYFQTSPVDSPQLLEIQQLLAGWDGDMGQDSVAATVFFMWSNKLKDLMFLDELTVKPNRLDQSLRLQRLINGISSDRLVSILKRNSRWCDDVNTPLFESCDDIVQLALAQTKRELHKVLGSNHQDWTWGRLSHKFYGHQGIKGFPVIDDWLGAEISVGGSANTVNVSSGIYSRTKGQVNTFGAGFRHVIELNTDKIKYQYINSTGQSGNFMSEHYDDMLKPFHHLQYLNLDEPSAAILKLTPKAD